MSEDNYMSTIHAFVRRTLQDKENPMVGVEENAGSIWITFADGSVKSILIIDCEPQTEDT